MAKMTMNLDPDEILGGLIKFAESDEVAKKMVAAGQEVMRANIEAGAQKHRSELVRKHMADSVKAYPPVVNNDGDIVGRVKFEGSAGTKKSKSGKRFDNTTWIRAFRVEYGTTNQDAEPFVRPAIRKSKKEIERKMKEVFDMEVKP